ncbi:MAG: GNAT family N-acetyltransferase [Acidimicrobiales bacterium]
MPDDATWLSVRPPARLDGAPVFLARPSLSDAQPLATAVNESLEELRPWMPWAQAPASAQTMGTFLRRAAADWDRGCGFTYLIRRADDLAIIGCCGLHARIGPGALEIGYWVHSRHTGRGVATAAADALTGAAFGLRGVERVEIRCDAANHRSAAVALRLGYRAAGFGKRLPSAPGETGEELVWIKEQAPVP